MKIAKIEITNSVGYTARHRAYNFIVDFLFITTDKSKDQEYHTYLYMDGEGRIEGSSESFLRKREPSRHHIFKQI